MPPQESSSPSLHLLKKCMMKKEKSQVQAAKDKKQHVFIVSRSTSFSGIIVPCHRALKFHCPVPVAISIAVPIAVGLPGRQLPSKRKDSRNLSLQPLPSNLTSSCPTQPAFPLISINRSHSPTPLPCQNSPSSLFRHFHLGRRSLSFLHISPLSPL